MTLSGKEFLLVDVLQSTDTIGCCSITGKMVMPGESYPETKIFFVGDEPISAMISRVGRDTDHADKLIAQIGTVKSVDDNIMSRFSVATDNFYLYHQSFSKAIQPVIEMLTPGLYVCHEAKMIPTDGEGNYFWSAYTQRREVSGTARYSKAINTNHNCTPCFLIPTETPADISEVKIKHAFDNIQSGKGVGGVAFHLSGMFSMLLYGHHATAACLLADKDFRCLLIEPLTDVVFESDIEARRLERVPRISALACPYVKIPLGQLPSHMLEHFLELRQYSRPPHYAMLKNKSNTQMRISSKKIINKDIFDKARMMPNIEMITSAHSINSLSEEQIACLLQGEVELNGEVIIDSNFYNSIVTACNYLQYNNFDRYITFAIDIINERELSSMHKYVCDRLCTIMNERVYNYFHESVSDENRVNVKKDLVPLMDKYVDLYEKDQAEKEAERQKLIRAKNALAGRMTASDDDVADAMSADANIAPSAQTQKLKAVVLKK
jgi:hypothetical protein